MNTNILSREEFHLLSDPAFYMIRKRLGEKVMQLLGECSIQIAKELESSEEIPESEVLNSRPKISRGENYLSYPWTILDFPRYFKGEDVFVIRTLCWWGNGLSITLHLSGIYAEKYQAALNSNAAFFADRGYAVCINEDPWQHHYGTSNYQLLNLSSESGYLISRQYYKNKFVKIMKQLPFSDWEVFPIQSAEITRDFLRAMRL